jgi:integrase
LADLTRRIKVDIEPELGGRLINDLTFSDLSRWHQALANAPARLRTKAKATHRNVRVVEADDTEGRRARRATANRTLSVVKAGLSLAYREGRAASDDAWRRVKPFQKADAPRVRYLTDPEAVRLTNACPPPLRRLVTAALLTGCRYSELTGLVASDFDAHNASLQIRQAKAGRRTVPLTDDAKRFFTQVSAGKAGDAVILLRDDGHPWGKSQVFRPLREACTAAKIAPAISFHILRHTFASRLLMKGVPMAVVAAALGNTEAICARHYAHMAKSYIADAIRAHAGGLDIVPTDGNVAAMSL